MLHQDKKLGVLILTIIFLVSLASIWKDVNYTYKELWVIDCTIIRNPSGKTHLDKLKPPNDFFKIVLEESNKSNWNSNWKANRKFNSGVIYISAENKTIVDDLEPIIKSRTSNNFIRILGKDDYLNILNITKKQTLIVIACYLFALVTIVIKLPYKYATLTIITGALALVINEYNRSNSKWQEQLETKVVNDLATPGNTFGHRHAENLLKSHIGEITIELLNINGHRTSFRTRNANDVFQKSTTRKKAQSLWIRSSATKSETAIAKKNAEDLAKFTTHPTNQNKK